MKRRRWFFVGVAIEVRARYAKKAAEIFSRMNQPSGIDAQGGSR